MAPSNYKTIYPPSLIIQEQLRHAAQLKREKIYATLWKPTYDAILAINGSIYGHAPTKKDKYNRADPHRIVVFKSIKSVYDNAPGINQCYHTLHDPEWVLAQPLEALPLLINTLEEYPEAYKALKDRMSGTTPQTQCRQDLIDQYYDAEKKLSAQYVIIGQYDKVITDYITNKMYKAYPREMKYHTTFLAILHINGRDYTWCSTDHHNSKLIMLPDSLTVHIHESDVLADEAADPAIHGSTIVPIDTPAPKGRRSSAKVFKNYYSADD
jgi:hypothetical protein